jgi:hypothetical protein
LNFKVWFFVFSFFAFLPAPAGAEGISEDINNLSGRAEAIGRGFMQESLPLRLACEYDSESADRGRLQKLAEKADRHLEEIAGIQNVLKKKIEDYEGPDWEDKYGSTGLWRKLSTDVYTTILIKSQIDYYLARTKQPSQRARILREALVQIYSIGEKNLSAEAQLLKAQITSLLARIDLTYKPAALFQLNLLAAGEDIDDAIRLRASIEEINLIGQADPEQLDALTEKLVRSHCSNDVELILSLAFLKRRLERSASLEKAVAHWPQAEALLGRIILSGIEYRLAKKQNPKQVSVFEAELAAQAAWRDATKDYKAVLDYLSSEEKFQTPLLLYASAVKSTESSPDKAIHLMIKASRLQQQQKSDRLGIDTELIARQAAQLAYNLFLRKSLECPLILESFDNYIMMAGEEIDEELEYFYAGVLNDCGQPEKGVELLEKIASRLSGKYRHKATFELIMKEIEKRGNHQESMVFYRLRELILDCSGQDRQSNKLRQEAISIYCDSLLEFNNEQAAQSVLTLLAKAATTRSLNMDLFKAKAFQQLGRLDEAAGHMLSATWIDDGSIAPAVKELLTDVVEQIDRYNGAFYMRMMQNCRELAQFTYDSINDWQSGVLLAEISIFTAEKNKEKLLEAEGLLRDLSKEGRAEQADWLRCQARLLTEQGEFEQAARLWARVSDIRKDKTPFVKRQGWQWWQAKFYELYCWGRRPETKREEILHTIEVLENTFPPVPPLWAERFNSLK